jgi:hypothetical protein
MLIAQRVPIYYVRRWSGYPQDGHPRSEAPCTYAAPKLRPTLVRSSFETRRNQDELALTLRAYSRLLHCSKTSADYSEGDQRTELNAATKLSVNVDIPDRLLGAKSCIRFCAERDRLDDPARGSGPGIHCGFCAPSPNARVHANPWSSRGEAPAKADDNGRRHYAYVLADITGGLRRGYV